MKKLAFAFKHDGLESCIQNTQQVLMRKHDCVVWHTATVQDVRDKLKGTDVTHVVISVPWLDKFEMYSLATEFTDVTFIVRCHSNIAFLQASPWAVRNFLAACEMQGTLKNLFAAANSTQLSQWVEQAYGEQCVFLPDLYYLHGKPVPKSWDGLSLSIAIPGAPRAQKNIMTAGCAAVALAQRFQVPTVIWVSGGRDEKDGKGIKESLAVAITRNALCSFREFPWQSNEEFKRFLSTCDLMIQCSHTETFNYCVADGVSVGLPSVISSAIRWPPKAWQADSDDACAIARVGETLLTSPSAAAEGYGALCRHNNAGLYLWRNFLHNPLT